MSTATANTVHTILTALGRNATIQTYFERINTPRKKLTHQTWTTGWLVFMGAGGSNVCAAYAPASTLPPNKTIIDQTLYWATVPTEDEAIYLTGMLNSTAITQVIREFQPRGQFGERHIHTLPLGVTPPFDAKSAAHVDVVTQTKHLIAEWTTYQNTHSRTMPDLWDPNQASLQIRRKKIKEILSTLPSWAAYEKACQIVYCID
jgi:hypothetical protein